MSRFFKIAAGISLGLNVLFIGIAIGAMVHHHPPHEMMDRERQEIINALPPDKRQSVTPLLDKTLAAQQASIEHLHQLRSKMQTILEASEFNAGEFASVVDEVERERASLGGSLGELFKAVAGAQDREGRMRFAHWFEHFVFPFPPPPPHRHD